MENRKRALKRDTRRSSDGGWQLVESSRAGPHFNEINFPSADMGGYNQIAESHLDTDAGLDPRFETGFEAEFVTEFEEIRAEETAEASRWPTYIIPSVSENTDSTTKQGAGRTEPSYAVAPDSTGSTLTREALQEMDHQQFSHYHIPGDTRGWVQSGVYTPQIQPSNHSTEVMADHSRSSGSYTESSWNHVAHPLESPVHQTDEWVCDTGSQFVDTPSTYALYGSTIPDELLRGPEA